MRKYLNLLFIIIFFNTFCINHVESSQNILSGNKFGIYIHDEYGKDIIDRTVSMGSVFTYTNIFWNEVEPGQDRWDWTAADAMILTRLKRGLEVGIRLISSNHWGTETVTPLRAIRKIKKKGRKKRDSSPPKDLKTKWNDKYGYSRDYYDFVYHTVKRYGKKVKYWAIENEITYKMNFTGGSEKYKLLLPTAYKAVKDARQDAYVVSHAPSSMSYGEVIAFELFKSGREKEAVEFYNAYMFPHRNVPRPGNIDELKNIFRKTHIPKKYKIIIDGLKNSKYYDIYQLHYYDKADMLDRVLKWIEDKKKEYFNNRPIVCWEMGYFWKKNRTYNKIEHAKDIFKKFIVLLSHNIKTINYHSIFGRSEKNDPWRGLYQNYSGIEKRPAAYVFENLVMILKDARYEVRSRLDDGIYLYRFIKGSQTLYFLWSIKKKPFLCLNT